MTLRFKKGKNGKGNSFSCIRDDGSTTYQAETKIPPQHDLIHYAVETTMGWREGFLGLVAAGRDMNSFGTKDGVKDTYTNEARWAEMTVGMLQWPALSQGGMWTDEELLEMNRQTFDGQNILAPPLTPRLLEEMRARAIALHRQWDALPEGETLELMF